MNQGKINSRRNFLSTLGILSSGTVLAGSPLALFENGSTEQDLKSKWALMTKKYGAGNFLNISGSAIENHMQPVKGLQYANGQVVSFAEQGLLAQPIWIHWTGRSGKPDDVVIHFFEDVFPYKKVKSINRYELLALQQLPLQENLLQAVCQKSKSVTGSRVEITTRVAKRKIVQETKCFTDHTLVLKQQFLYNV